MRTVSFASALYSDDDDKMSTVAVLAFKAVYTLETKRRENDKKIISLYVEMKDMMSVLVRCVTSLSRLKDSLLNLSPILD